MKDTSQLKYLVRVCSIFLNFTFSNPGAQRCSPIKLVFFKSYSWVWGTAILKMLSVCLLTTHKWPMLMVNSEQPSVQGPPQPQAPQFLCQKNVLFLAFLSEVAVIYRKGSSISTIKASTFTRCFSLMIKGLCKDF